MIERYLKTKQKNQKLKHELPLIDTPEVTPRVWWAIYHTGVQLIRDHGEDEKKKEEIKMSPELSGSWKRDVFLLLQVLPTRIQQQQQWWKKEQKASQNKMSANFCKTRGNRQSWLNKGKKGPTDKHLIRLHNIWTETDGNKPVIVWRGVWGVQRRSQLWWGTKNIWNALKRRMYVSGCVSVIRHAHPNRSNLPKWAKLRRNGSNTSIIISVS